MKTTLIIFFILINTKCLLISSLIIKFSNLECNLYDKGFAAMEKCHLKVVGRDKTAAFVKFRLMQTPLTNMLLNVQLFRKSYDYRPFMYNSTMDVCKFLRNKNKLLFWKILLDAALPYTNINHTCPYNHDLILNGIVLEEKAIQLIPFPSADYMIQLHMFVDNDLKFRLKFYFEINERKA